MECLYEGCEFRCSNGCVNTQNLCEEFRRHYLSRHWEREQTIPRTMDDLYEFMRDESVERLKRQTELFKCYIDPKEDPPILQELRDVIEMEKFKDYPEQAWNMLHRVFLCSQCSFFFPTFFGWNSHECSRSNELEAPLIDENKQKAEYKLCELMELPLRNSKYRSQRLRGQKRKRRTVFIAREGCVIKLSVNQFEDVEGKRSFRFRDSCVEEIIDVMQNGISYDEFRSYSPFCYWRVGEVPDIRDEGKTLVSDFYDSFEKIYHQQEYELDLTKIFEKGWEGKIVGHMLADRRVGVWKRTLSNTLKNADPSDYIVYAYGRYKEIRSLSDAQIDLRKEALGSDNLEPGTCLYRASFRKNGSERGRLFKFETRQYEKCFWLDGTLMSEIQMSDGKMHGIHREYHPNGKKSLKCVHKNDIQVGHWKSYDKEGKGIAEGFCFE